MFRDSRPIIGRKAIKVITIAIKVVIKLVSKNTWLIIKDATAKAIPTA